MAAPGPKGGSAVSKFHLELGSRRGWHKKVNRQNPGGRPTALVIALEELDMIFRALVSTVFNCAPNSGHPGGSLSAGPLLSGLLYGGLDYELSRPKRKDADQIVFAAGHKALGLYVAWALRDELARLFAPQLLPKTETDRLRLEDLLGFRRNPVRPTALQKNLRSKFLDGHPTPATPFVPLATGASGVGLGAACGLALGAMDLYPDDPPRVHVIEGEGGLTPGRVAEAMSASAIAGLHNLVLHIDFNQASIDSDQVCRQEEQPGDYVPWDPAELARFHDFNVVEVAEGHSFEQVLKAQALAREIRNDQPTAVVYRTVKGFRYGIEGRAAHGAGHACCSEGFYQTLDELESAMGQKLPRLGADPDSDSLDEHFWDLLQSVRAHMTKRSEVLAPLVESLIQAHRGLDERSRKPRPDRPRYEDLFNPIRLEPPETLRLEPGQSIALKDALGRGLAELNRRSGGALILSSADLAGSTSIAKAAEAFGAGFYHSSRNPASRLLATGGICEDAMGAILSGLSSYGAHLAVGSSYGAFIAALEHVSARLHAIGQQAALETQAKARNPYLMVCGHAGLKTGEDGPTHADPQCLQLLQDNFPMGACITLTPWEPGSVWPCLLAGLQQRPALLAIFVTRPPELVPDRQLLGLPKAETAAFGLEQWRTGDRQAKPYHGSLVLQGSDVALTFTQEVLAKLDSEGLNMNVFVVTSAELFDALPAEEQEALFPEACMAEAMGITGFTGSTLHRWVASPAGRAHSRHAFSRGRYLGSGPAEQVMEEAGLDAASQWQAVLDYARHMESKKQRSAS